MTDPPPGCLMTFFLLRNSEKILGLTHCIAKILIIMVLGSIHNIEPIDSGSQFLVSISKLELIKKVKTLTVKNLSF